MYVTLVKRSYYRVARKTMLSQQRIRDGTAAPSALNRRRASLAFHPFGALFLKMVHMRHEVVVWKDKAGGGSKYT